MKSKPYVTLILALSAIGASSLWAAPPIKEHHPIAEQQREQRQVDRELRQQRIAMQQREYRYYYNDRNQSSIALMVEPAPSKDRPDSFFLRHKRGIHNR